MNNFGGNKNAEFIAQLPRTHHVRMFRARFGKITREKTTFMHIQFNVNRQGNEFLTRTHFKSRKSKEEKNSSNATKFIRKTNHFHKKNKQNKLTESFNLCTQQKIPAQHLKPFNQTKFMHIYKSHFSPHTQCVLYGLIALRKRISFRSREKLHLANCSKEPYGSFS